MNMIIQISELHRQNELHRLRRERLWRGPMIAKPQKIEPPVAIEVPEAKKIVTRKVPQVKVIDVLAAKEERIRQLELDLADAQARILSQAEHICVLNDIEAGSPPSFRKAAAVIIHEILQDFPGVTWEDLKSVRRERRLIAPRQICMAALYEQRKDLSLPQIGRMFHRDHTTVLHAVQKIRAEGK